MDFVFFSLSSVPYLVGLGQETLQRQQPGRKCLLRQEVEQEGAPRCTSSRTLSRSKTLPPDSTSSFFKSAFGPGVILEPGIYSRAPDNRTMEMPPGFLCRPSGQGSAPRPKDNLYCFLAANARMPSPPGRRPYCGEKKKQPPLLFTP